MRKKAFLQLLGAILSGLSTAVPFFIDQQGRLPNWPWQYHALISFVIFALIMGWIIYDKQQKINDLAQGRPAITVSCETNYGNLRIVNDSNMAVFRAKAQRVEDGEIIGESWFIKWKGSFEIDQTIYKGDSHILEVASCEWMYSMKDGVQSRKSHIRFCNVPQLAIDADTGEKYIQHYDLSSRHTSEEIEIKIFSQPDLQLPFKQRYSLKLIPDDDTVSIEEVSAEIKSEL